MIKKYCDWCDSEISFEEKLVINSGYINPKRCDLKIEKTKKT